MITRNEIVPIGHIAKLHGIHGELVAVVDSDVELLPGYCVVMEIEGIFVPFFLSTVRRRSAESLLITLDGFASQKLASEFQGLTLYMTIADLDAQEDELDDDDESDESDHEDGFYANDLIGVTLCDSVSGQTVGTVTDLDTTTANILFIVRRNDDTTAFIPVAPELIESYDHAERKLTMQLPTGLLDL